MEDMVLIPTPSPAADYTELISRMDYMIDRLDLVCYILLVIVGVSVAVLVIYLLYQAVARFIEY